MFQVSPRQIARWPSLLAQHHMWNEPRPKGRGLIQLLPTGPMEDHPGALLRGSQLELDINPIEHGELGDSCMVKLGKPYFFGEDLSSSNELYGRFRGDLAVTIVEIYQ